MFLPESDIDMVVLPPRELPVHEVRANLYKLADVRALARPVCVHIWTSGWKGPIRCVCSFKRPSPVGQWLIPHYITQPTTHPPHQAFKGDSAVTAMEVIAKARVPIIKLRFNNLQVNECTHLHIHSVRITQTADIHLTIISSSHTPPAPTTHQVDISFSSDSGLKSARYMLERMEALPALRPLILVLKYFLVRRVQRGWTESSLGSSLEPPANSFTTIPIPVVNRRSGT